MPARRRSSSRIGSYVGLNSSGTSRPSLLPRQNRATTRRSRSLPRPRAEESAALRRRSRGTEETRLREPAIEIEILALSKRDVEICSLNARPD